MWDKQFAVCFFCVADLCKQSFENVTNNKYKISLMFECVSLPTVHSLLCQLLVEVWSVGGGKKGGFLNLTQPNVGFTISAQNHLKTTRNMKYIQLMLQNTKGSALLYLMKREKVIVSRVLKH